MEGHCVIKWQVFLLELSERKQKENKDFTYRHFPPRIFRVCLPIKIKRQIRHSSAKSAKGGTDW